MTVKITINGPIISSEEKWIYNYFGEESTCAKDVRSALPKSGEDVEVTINSYGGYVDQGAEIYTILRNYQGNVVINVISAYSAASIIAMAGDSVRMSPVGRLMIHNASAGNYGDFHDMDKMSDVLKNANEAMSAAYMEKTGLSKQEILKKMDTETWLTAEEAIEMGFADELMFSSTDQPRLVAFAGAGMLSRNVIEKAKETLMNKPIQVTSTVDPTEVETMIETKIAAFFATQSQPIITEIPKPHKQTSLLTKLRKGATNNDN